MKFSKSILFSSFCLALLPILLHGNTMQSLPSIVSSGWDKSQLIGQTTFRKYGFHIYDASYWLLERKPADRPAANSNALMIEYARDIKAKKLVASTAKQWNKIGISKDYPTEQWLNELTAIWPDVSNGDLLIALVTQGGPTQFYSGDRLLGEIKDTEFGPAFLAIWLSNESRYQKNRKELLNES